MAAVPANRSGFATDSQDNLGTVRFGPSPKTIRMQDSTSLRNQHPLIRVAVGEPTVLLVIAINVIAMFVTAFPEVSPSVRIFFEWIDYLCTCYFLAEAITKISLFGFRGYWSRPWYRFDFVIVIACLPLLLQPPSMDTPAALYAIAPLLRLGRFLRFMRLMRFIPDAPRMWRGTVRAMKASIGVFVVLFVLNLILAMGANILFADRAPQYFGNPLTASYTLFKVFTVEGWNEIPDEMARNRNVSRTEVALIRGYFIAAVLIGGILGLSLANAIFVDEMTMDNNEELERQVSFLQDQILELRDEVREALKK